MTPAYAEDLAYIHDAGFGGFARQAAPGVIALFVAGGAPSGKVVDLGCGSGILARALTDAGYTTVGVDGSRAMLALARKRAPKARFRQSSLWDVELPPCDAVTATGECFNYFEGGPARRTLGRVFRRIHSALRPGGLFVFDVAGAGRASGGKRCWEGEDWAILVESEEDGGGVLTRRMTTFRRKDGRWRRGKEVHRQRLFPCADVAADLRRAGFRVRTLRSYGAEPFPKGLAGFVARKP